MIATATRKEGGCRKPRDILYGIYSGMIARCHGERRDGRQRHYKDRGIAVCEEWRGDFRAFRDWSLANGWEEGLTLDRIDVDGDYGPGNCRWTTPIVQANNRRNNRRVVAFGEMKTLTQWSRDPRCRVSHACLTNRLNGGWDPEDAISRPSPRKGNRPRIRAFGEEKFARKWSRDPRCRVLYATLLQRLDLGWDPEEAITTPANEGPTRPRRPRRDKIAAFGETRSITQWSRDSRCKVPYFTLRTRLDIGWAPERAISEPSRRRRRRRRPREEWRPPITAFGETKRISAWLRDPRCGLAYSTLRRRLDLGWDPERAITERPHKGDLPLPPKRTPEEAMGLEEEVKEALARAGTRAREVFAAKLAEAGERDARAKAEREMRERAELEPHLVRARKFAEEAAEQGRASFRIPMPNADFRLPERNRSAATLPGSVSERLKHKLEKMGCVVSVVCHETQDSGAYNEPLCYYNFELVVGLP